MKILIADDEPGIVLSLRHLVSSINGIDNIAVASSVKEARHVALEEDPDIALLDIQFPDGTGIELARELLVDNPELSVLFITADPGFTLEAYELYSVDYILKPFDEIRVVRTMRRIIKQKCKAEIGTPIVNRFAIKDGREIIFFDRRNIIMLEKSRDYVIAYSYNAEYRTGESLGSLHCKIGPSFFRSHKSYIINLAYVERIVPSGNTYEIRFIKTQHKALLSRKQYKDLLEHLHEMNVRLLD